MMRFFYDAPFGGGGEALYLVEDDLLLVWPCDSNGDTLIVRKNPNKHTFPSDEQCGTALLSDKDYDAMLETATEVSELQIQMGNLARALKAKIANMS